MKTVKLNAKQLRSLIECIVEDAKSVNSTKKKLQEKMELGRMGAEHGALMDFDSWEAGANTTDPDVVNHMREQHMGEKKSEMQWAKLYNQYEQAMAHPVF